MARAKPLAAAPRGSGLEPVMGDHGPPVVGYTLTLLDDMLAFAHRHRARYGDISWIGGFGTRVVVLLGPDPIGEVLTNRERAFSNERGWGYFIGPFFRRGVMLMDFEEHLHHRRIMQQAFRNERLVAYLASMNPAIERGIGAWRAGDGFRLYTHAKQLTLDLANAVFVGDALGAEADRLNRAFEAAVRGGATMLRADVPGGRWHRGLKGRRLLLEALGSHLQAKRSGDGTDLFSALCRAQSEEGERFTDEDVLNHMLFVLMAAHDTSTLTLAMMAYLIARHPQWQERLREESRALGKVAIEYEDLERLPAMDLVMRETLRMYAPVGILFRETLTDTAVGGRYLPAGTKLGLALYPSQRMEPWWSDPDRFDPERFAPGRREDQSHKYAWTPFGGGVHKCIGMHFGGMEVKTVLHHLLLRFSWTVPDAYEVPLTYGTGPLPSDGLPVRLRAL